MRLKDKPILVPRGIGWTYKSLVISYETKKVSPLDIDGIGRPVDAIYRPVDRFHLCP